METGILYVVFNNAIRDQETNELLYKIGITKNTVDIRYHSIGLKMPGKFETLFAYRLKDYIKIEKGFHNILDDFRINGEWFKLSQKELDYIRETCEFKRGIPVTNEVEFETKNDIILETRSIPNISYNNNSINPKFPCKIFVFSIYKARNGGKSVYDATRSAWQKIGKFLDTLEYKYAVGLVNKYSEGSFKIDNWKYVPNNRHEFTGEEISDFTGFSWEKQINEAGGWWNFGNPLVVEFDGKGKFRLLLPNKKHWTEC